MKAMKALLTAGAMLALTACSNEDDITNEPTTATEPAQTITFNLTASHPDDGAAAQTRAVKQGWESGDAIFVFFTGVAAPKHLKMTYNDGVWTSAEYNGATQTDGALGLKNGDTGTMRAVYLPFGSSATVTADGTSFKFSTDYYTYYATATLAYTVTNNEVDGAFDMTIPDDWVQFFVEDGDATSGDYTLSTDAVCRTGIASIGADGSIAEFAPAIGGEMPGYAYGGGYLFSGLLNDGYTSQRYEGETKIDNDAYYFAKTKVADGSRADYFVTGKTLGSHSAVKLPANDNVYALKYGTPNTGKWVPVGSGVTVTIGNVTGSGMSEAFSNFGTWHTCNYGQTAPEALGTLYNFADANALGVTLPTKAQCETLANGTKTAFMNVHGQLCMAAKADRGLILLPCDDIVGGDYWTSTEYNSYQAWTYNFSTMGGNTTIADSKSVTCPVRGYVN